jgi:hypothetical protein
VLKLDPTSSGPLAPSTGAFQSEPSSTACGLLGAFATYVTGEYGATPAAISVDAKGDVFVAGTTISPDYPPTPNAYEPQYLASAAPKVSCFFHH